MFARILLTFVLISFEAFMCQHSQASEFEDSYNREVIDKLLKSPTMEGPNCLGSSLLGRGVLS
jgi:hypothetical protein